MILQHSDDTYTRKRKFPLRERNGILRNGTNKKRKFKPKKLIILKLTNSSHDPEP